MSEQIDSFLLKDVVSDVLRIEPRGRKPISGLMVRHIREEGHYIEGGLEFTEKDLLFSQLYSSVAVLTRDMHRYLRVKGNYRDDATTFENLVKVVHHEEYEVQGAKAFPAYVGLPDELAPPTVDLGAPGGHIDLSPLDDADLIHEWHFKPGKRLLVKLFGRTDVRELVCKAGGSKDFVGRVDKAVQPAVVVKVSEAIIASTFTAAAFWYPLAAFGAFYIVKTSLNWYCHC